MKIKLLELTLINFMGADKLVIPLSDLTNIFADNGIGKTRFFNAFTWLLFGKDSNDSTKFDIKNTVDRSKNKLDHEVSARIQVPGEIITLKRIHKEKWTKKRGEEKAELTGHEDEFFWNDVPMKKGDYENKVNALLNEKLFKLITNVTYFNSLKPDERRRVLLDIAGDVDNTTILDSISTLNNKQEIFELTNLLNSSKSLDEYRLEVATKRRKLVDQLKTIPTRIDEVSRNMPEAVNVDEINALIESVNKQITIIDTEMTDLSVAYQESFKSIQDQQNKIHNLRSSLNDISYKIKDGIQKKENDHRINRSKLVDQKENIERDVKSKNILLSSSREKVDTLNTRIETGRKQWYDINSTQIEFDQHEFTCPTCKRHIEPADMEAKKLELTNNFNTEKQRKLSDNVSAGKQLIEQKNEAENLINTLKNAIDALNKELERANLDLKSWDEANSVPKQNIDEVIQSDPEYVKIQAEIKELEASLPESPKIDLTDQKNRRQTLLSELDIYKNKLSMVKVIENNNNRVKELEAEESKLSQEIANLERTEFMLNDFSKAKMDIVEERINKCFKYVRFRLFDRQINGAEVPVCDTLVPNRDNTGFVPWNSGNTAARINGGLDIINTLSAHYGVFVPIFIDGAESVTKLIDSKSQIIRLVVSEADKSLRIENHERELVS